VRSRLPSWRLIYSGGTEIVSSGGTDFGALISGGEQDVYGYASGATVFTGSQVVETGGSASGTVVSGGGLEIVSSSGTVSNTTVLSGGTLEPFGGASISGTTTINAFGCCLQR
jgi:autotransporter passenger strand-loop-strand repeat protein